MLFFVLGLKPNSTVQINDGWDLKGEKLVIPENVTLSFGKNGSIRNGVLVGNQTRISGDTEGIFDAVGIDGSWCVPQIDSKMFSDLSAENALVPLFALASSTEQNTIRIAEGSYTLVASSEKPNVLTVVSNTEVIIDGVVRLAPNDLGSYKMFDLRGDHIYLHGSGEIVGDRMAHTGETGEWGMGISMQRASDIRIEDLTVRDCWGDCIYVSKRSDNVRIKHCKLLNSRRQGISITSAGFVHVSDCLIQDIHGTNPQYGIDVEPNKRDTVDFVLVDRVSMVDCRGGITVSCSPTKECQVSRIEINDCTVQGCVERYSYKFSNTKTVIMRHCSGVKRNIRFKNIEYVFVEDNRITELEDKSLYYFGRCKDVIRR